MVFIFCDISLDDVDENCHLVFTVPYIEASSIGYTAYGIDLPISFK